MTGRRIILGTLLAGLVAAVVYAGVSIAGEDPYFVRAELKNADGLIEGYSVRIAGAPVGRVSNLKLLKNDHVLAEMKIDKSAGPVGRDATATVRTLDLFGERFVDLKPGNTRDPAPSGALIPPQRAYVTVEMDDVINSLDRSTRDALAVFIDEQGTAFAGRGRNLGDLLKALPPSLDSTGKLLAGLGRDNRALGRLVEESDRVVGAVARERASFGRLVDNGATTLDTLGRRHRELGETVRRAPATLASARRALGTLQGAAIPLAPAARGLRATAPSLTATLRELPPFEAAARPTLRTARDVAPALGTLGRQGTPVVRRLRPLTTQLSTFATAFDPSVRILSQGWPNQLGLMEGWARSTQVHDAASQIFRFGGAGVDDPTAFRKFLERLGNKDESGGSSSGASAKDGSRSGRARRAKPRSSESRRPARRARARVERRLPARVPRTKRPPVGRRAGGQTVRRARRDSFLLDYLLRP